MVFSYWHVGLFCNVPDGAAWYQIGWGFHGSPHQFHQRIRWILWDARTRERKARLKICLAPHRDKLLVCRNDWEVNRAMARLLKQAKGI